LIQLGKILCSNCKHRFFTDKELIYRANYCPWCASDDIVFEEKVWAFYAHPFPGAPGVVSIKCLECSEHSESSYASYGIYRVEKVTCPYCGGNNVDRYRLGLFP